MRFVSSQTPTWPTQKVCARHSSKFPAPDRGHVARPPLPRDMNQHVHVPSEMPGARNWFWGCSSIPYCNLTRQWGSPILGGKYWKVSRNGGCFLKKNTRFTQRLKFDVSCWPLRPWRAATHAQLEAGLLFRRSSGKGSAHDQKVMVELC